MKEFLYDVYCFLCGFAVEVFAFSVIEGIARAILAHTSDTNKREAVFLTQCAAMFLLSAMFFLHHTPYFLMAMASFALCYRLLLGRVDLGIYWHALRSMWQDFLEYYDSLGKVPPLQPEQDSTCTSAPPLGSQNRNNSGLVYPEQQSQPPLASPAGGGIAVPQNQVQPDVAAVPVAPTAPVLVRPNQMAGSSSQSLRPRSVASTVASSVPVVNKSATSVDAELDGAFSSFGISNFISQIPTSVYLVKTWFQKTLGRDASIPPGLVNNSQENLCFINCVLQTLSRSPRLRDNLKLAVDAAGRMRHLSSEVENFLRQMTDVFCKLTVPDEMTLDGPLFYKATLDTRLLRRVIHHICKVGHLVEEPSSDSPQQQQDAAEFLLWCLDTLHDASRMPLAPGTASIYARPSIHQLPMHQNSQSAVSNSMQTSLDQLMAAYNYPTRDTVVDLRRQCQAQLARVDGSDHSSYVDLVTSLSNLDWLLYKNQNRSIVDDLFTGQQVSASYCLGCKHISVSTDTFRIMTLPVPLNCDSITIRSCFEQLIEVEHLTQLNRPRIESCKCFSQNILPGNSHHLYNSSSNFQTSTPNGPQQRGAGNFPCSPGMGALLSPINGVSRDQRIEPPSYTTLTPMSFNPPATIVDCHRQTSLQRLPDCLVVQLLRFRFVDNSSFKIRTRVKLSIDPVDLSSLVLVRRTPRQPLLYSLYGICLHSNSMSTTSGHYFAYSLSSDGQWYLFNDSTVSRVEIENELGKREVQENAYILYYRRVTSTARP